MKKQSTLPKILAMGIVLVLILTGCPPGVDPNTDPNIDPADTTDTTDTAAATAAVSKGLSDLVAKKYSDAQTSFMLALVADPTNVDAQFWVSFMQMASLNVDPTVVDLFKNRIGVSGYPTTLETLFSDTWFNGTYYFPREGNIVDGMCDTQMLPALNVPSFMAEFGITAEYPSIYMYPAILAANIAVKNPTGFNAVVDAVNTIALGSTFDTIIARISAMSDTARVVIPASLMTAYSSPEAVAELNGATVSLGKAELLLWVAQIQMERAFVQYLASVDFSYDMDAVVDAIADLDMETIRDDADEDGVPDQLAASLNATPGFYGTNLLKERDASKRAASKTSFVAAVGSLKRAATLLNTQWADSASYYSTTATALEMPDELREEVAHALQTAANAANALATAVNTSTGLTLPSDTYVLGAAWPTSADAFMTVYPAAIWASNVLDPRTWFESNDTDGFVNYMSYRTEYNDSKPDFYSAEVAWEDSFTIDDFGNPQLDQTVGFIMASIQIKLLDSRIQEFCDIEALDLYPTIGGWSVYDDSFSEPNLNEPLFTTIIDWVNK